MTVSATFTLHDDDSTREKLTVMDKWDVMTDDERNPQTFGDEVNAMLQVGKSYRVTVEEVPSPGPEA